MKISTFWREVFDALLGVWVGVLARLVARRIVKAKVGLAARFMVGRSTALLLLRN